MSSSSIRTFAIVLLVLLGALTLWPQQVNYQLYGLDFSPFLDGQNPNQNLPISATQIQQRMAIVSPYTAWIRTFGCTNGLGQAGAIAHGMGKKAAIGVWIDGDLAVNDSEVACAIAVAQAGNADMVIVGSEVLRRGHVSEQQLLNYMTTVRNALSAVFPPVPVTTAEVYGILLDHPNLIQASDVVMGNFYGYWEGSPLNLAVGSLHSSYLQLVAASGMKTVIVSETGWPSAGNPVGAAFPSPENAAAYFLNFVSWARANNVPYFYFEAFDEAWKAAEEGPQGAAWGLWNSAGSLKPGMQAVFDGQTVSDNWSGSTIPCGPGTPSITLTFVPPLGVDLPIHGSVCHVRPSDYKVAVYIRVGAGYWNKPTFAEPLTAIQADGTFTAIVNTNPNDILQTRARVFLVPNGYNPPMMQGETVFPTELNQYPTHEVLRGNNSICGLITASGSGAPVPGVALALTGTVTRNAQTVATGRYCFSDVPNGSYTVTPSKLNTTMSPPSQSISNLSGQATANFTSNGVPGTPGNPVPVNGATGISTAVTLQWTIAGSVTSNDVYFGTSSTPPFVANTAANTFSPGSLVPGTTYYWRIVSKNLLATASSPVWSFTTAGVGLRFVPVTPCRVIDTRLAAGPFGGPAVPGNTTRSVAVPQSACGIPSNAVAYSMNVTVVPSGSLGYLTMFPTGQTQPYVSTLNSLDGRIKANAAIVPAGTNGAVSVFVTHTTHVILDINGYFIPPSGQSNLVFYPVAPCRISDTRLAAGPFGGPTMSAGQTRSFTVPNAACSIPATAQAYSLNMTVVPHAPLNYLTTWPTGQQQPIVSTLNAPTGAVTANAAIVPAGTSGAINVYVTDPTDLIIDINGYFAPPGNVGELLFYPVNPCRISDTRNAAGPLGGPPLNANQSRTFPITSSTCGLPSTARAYSLNATVVPSGPLIYLTLWPTGLTQPVVSTLNSYDATIVSNAAIVPSGTGGSGNAFVSNPTDLILDTNGYFAP